jgi:RNA polymerase sigma-70 factor (ECF subfamily)
LSESLPASGVDQAKAAEQAEARRRVREAVRLLPEKQRQTLLLKVYDEMTHEEVARLLGSSVGTVKANLFHAIANLRRILLGDGRRG